MEVELEEYFSIRKNILDDSKDETGFINQRMILEEILPYMAESKLIDSEDFNEAYTYNQRDKFKLNAFTVNESGERLQLFIIDEGSIDDSSNDETLYVSLKEDYESQFKRVSRFVAKAIKGTLIEQIQDSDPVKVLTSKLSSQEGIEQFDVIEIFLISLTATVSFRGHSPQPRKIHFPNQSSKVTYKDLDGKKKSKEILFITRVIDLNFLFNAIVSRGNREALEVNFKKTFGFCLDVVVATEEKNFQSYLCVINADVLADLYKSYSTRLLEKNVRSFLQFTGDVNKGIKRTIKVEPEKFIAYNNGLTITATGVKTSHNKKKFQIESLSDLQIVNGGQTTAAIYFSRKDGLDVSKVKVMAKINVINTNDETVLDDLISNISEYSNSQSRVSKVDLRARNPQLVKFKSLSESVITPSGNKWYFERAKGEFNTKVRIAGNNGARIKKDFPPSRKFTKEMLAKYYCSWNEIPYLVKKGGEKIFRNFIESISPANDEPGNIAINRDFYEATIAKIIMFKELEKIYGAGPNSMGQLRSAVIPYSLSVVYLNTDGASNGVKFDLPRIWKAEGLEDDLREYFRALMSLMNELIKKYSLSEDYGEYSKKPELWSAIKNSNELGGFLLNENSTKIFKKYAKVSDT
ncbi:MAG: AIPR family protein [Bacteriovoracaceae bacterium]|nr:AIPR family protein [Bacteriovoracaceae bacterium]